MTRRGRFLRLAGAALVALVVAGAGFVIARTGDDEAALRQAVADGATVYAAHCASCHGADLKGQPNWRRVDARGRLPAPPQDHTGHSWMHSDAELTRLIRDSVYATAPPGYVSDMPAFRDKLSDRQIADVLAFIKSHWPTGVRAYQAFLNPDRAGMPKGAIDWSFPADCGGEPERPAPVVDPAP